MSTFTHARARSWRAPAGFSLIEMMIVVAVGTILAAMAVPVSSAYITQSRADGASIQLVDVLTTARDRAVGERRNFELTFINPNRVQISRVEVPSGLKTLISDMRLEGTQQFQVFATLPDTPDAFGKTSSIQFTGTGPWMFTSDGSFMDSNGDVSNGTVFLGVPNQTGTAGAVTVFGATGLLRSWRWRGSRWFNN